jgi:hypothetical protein
MRKKDHSFRITVNLFLIVESEYFSFIIYLILFLTKCEERAINRVPCKREVRLLFCTQQYWALRTLIDEYPFIFIIGRLLRWKKSSAHKEEEK